MKNITIVGDSLADNRPDKIPNNLRWPALLKAKMEHANIRNLSRGSSTTQRFKKAYSWRDGTDVLIVQIGIVDCAPRLFRKWENKIVAHLPKFLAGKIVKYAKLRRKQDIKRVYTKPASFRGNVLELFRLYEDKVILYIKILPASSKYISNNPTVDFAINLYNSIIDDCAKHFKNVVMIELSQDEVDICTLEDGYHLNVEGHFRIFDMVFMSLKQLFSTV